MTTSTLRSPTTAPGGLPVLGHALEMKRKPGEFLLSLQGGEPVTVIRMGREPMYVVNDVDLIRQVLRGPGTFTRGGPVVQRFRQMFGNGLGISDGDFHRRQRALIQPAFHHKRIVHYSALVSRLVAEKTASWQDGRELAVDREMDELALANVTEVIFAPGTVLDRSRFMAATSVVLGGLFRRMTDATGVLTRLPTAANRRYERAAGHLRDAINGVIRAYRAEGVDHGDLLSMMLFARDEDGRPAMSDQQLHDEVMTFFIAGSNTVANTLCWAFHEMSRHPAVERRLHEEVDRVCGGGPVSYEHVSDLKYTRRVITETLRVRTQGTFQSRLTATDTELGGYHIPAGTVVLYSLHALNHNPAIHAEPARFDPDRWLPERAWSIPRGAFMPFGAGVHSCVGEQFSWTEMIISLATIAAGWRLVPVPGHEPRPKPALTMPVDALPMTAHRRGATNRTKETHDPGGDRDHDDG